MAAKKKPAPRRRSRRRITKKKDTWKPAIAALAGGVGTAGLGYLAVRGGMSPVTTAVGLAAAGGVAALTMDGNARSAALGAAGMGTGQLALALITTQATKADGKKQLAAVATGKPKRNDSLADDIESAFERAREQLAMEAEAAAFTDEYDDEEVDA